MIFYREVVMGTILSSYLSTICNWVSIWFLTSVLVISFSCSITLSLWTTTYLICVSLLSIAITFSSITFTYWISWWIKGISISLSLKTSMSLFTSTSTGTTFSTVTSFWTYIGLSTSFYTYLALIISWVYVTIF